MLSKLIEQVILNGKNITFSAVLILVLIGGYKLVRYLLSIIREDLKTFGEQVKKLAESNKTMAGFLDLLVERSKKGPSE